MADCKNENDWTWDGEWLVPTSYPDLRSAWKRAMVDFKRYKHDTFPPLYRIQEIREELQAKEGIQNFYSAEEFSKKYQEVRVRTHKILCDVMIGHDTRCLELINEYCFPEPQNPV
jgi:hypothetical protein